jgi:hypothetical protein
MKRCIISRARAAGRRKRRRDHRRRRSDTRKQTRSRATTTTRLKHETQATLYSPLFHFTRPYYCSTRIPNYKLNPTLIFKTCPVDVLAHLVLTDITAGRSVGTTTTTMTTIKQRKRRLSIAWSPSEQRRFRTKTTCTYWLLERASRLANKIALSSQSESGRVSNMVKGRKAKGAAQVRIHFEEQVSERHLLAFSTSTR